MVVEVPVAKEEVLVSQEIGEGLVALFGVVVNLITIGVWVRSYLTNTKTQLTGLEPHLFVLG
jgi:sensor histidine kinase regulating citrate/malate metabolism